MSPVSQLELFSSEPTRGVCCAVIYFLVVPGCRLSLLWQQQAGGSLFTDCLPVPFSLVRYVSRLLEGVSPNLAHMFTLAGRRAQHISVTKSQPDLKNPYLCDNWGNALREFSKIWHTLSSDGLVCFGGVRFITTPGIMHLLFPQMGFLRESSHQRLRSDSNENTRCCRFLDVKATLGK